MPKNAKSLPVLMYHYISDHPDANAVSRKNFAAQCRALAEAGWRGVSLAEAEEFLEHREPLPEKSLLMSFDDGYLDNYLHALPLLRAYGHRAAVFAISGRLERETPPRVPLSEVLAGRFCPPKDLRSRKPLAPQGASGNGGSRGLSPLAGESEGAEPPQTSDPFGVNTPVRRDGFLTRRDRFCNVGEARAMEECGVVTVAAHSRGHLGVFTGPEYQGFARPQDNPRPFYGTALGRVWGLPDFPVKPGLLHRAFMPNPDLVAAVRELVPQDPAGAAAFFAEADNDRRLRALVDSFAEHLGRMERDEERRERLWTEIAGSKADLEADLGHPVRSFCWPWGRYAEDARQIALEAGFSVLFTTREGPNVPGNALAARRFKVRNKDGGWLLNRARVYGSPILGALYAKARR